MLFNYDFVQLPVIFGGAPYLALSKLKLKKTLLITRILYFGIFTIPR
jgi:hypothetical protein